MPKKLGRPDETRIARRLVMLFEYLKKRGLFDEVPGDADRPSIPLEELEEHFGYSEQELVGLLLDLACCSQCSYILVPIDVDEENKSVSSYESFSALQKPLRLSEAECEALVSALSMVGVDPDDPLCTRLVENAGSYDGAIDDMAGPRVLPESPENVAPMLSKLAEAIEKRHVVRFAYTRHSDGEVTQREIEPLGFSLMNGRWYLEGWCYLRQDYRTFLIDNIEELEDTGRTFDPRPDDISRFDEALQGEFPIARIAIAPQATIEKRDWPGLTICSTDSDGTRHATIPWAHTDWLPTQIVAGLGNIVVEDPQELQDAVRSLAAEKAARTIDIMTVYEAAAKAEQG